MGTYVDWSNVQSQLREELRGNEEYERQAETLIAEAEAEFDAKLGEQYSVPFTSTQSPTAFAWAQIQISRLVAGRAVRAVEQQLDDEALLWYANDLIEQAEAEISAAAAGRRYLADASESTTEGGDQVDDGYDDLTDTQQGDISPWFTRGDEW